MNILFGFFALCVAILLFVLWIVVCVLFGIFFPLQLLGDSIRAFVAKPDFLRHFIWTLLEWIVEPLLCLLRKYGTTLVFGVVLYSIAWSFSYILRLTYWFSLLSSFSYLCFDFYSHWIKVRSPSDPFPWEQGGKSFVPQ
jgi:hypothetical protein